MTETDSSKSGIGKKCQSRDYTEFGEPRLQVDPPVPDPGKVGKPKRGGAEKSAEGAEDLTKRPASNASWIVSFGRRIAYSDSFRDLGHA